MATIPWETTHSVETNAGPAFAWHYWTNIANWDDPPAKFELDGPFVTGSRGVTRLPGQEPLHWLIREVTPPNAATIEMSLDGAALLFEWRFVGLSDGSSPRRWQTPIQVARMRTPEKLPVHYEFVYSILR